MMVPRRRPLRQPSAGIKMAAPPDIAKEPRLWREEYGRKWEPVQAPNGQWMAAPDMVIERRVLKNPELAPGYEGFAEHFKRFVTSIWGRKECEYKFTWNPNCERMLEYAVKCQFLGLAGHASSSKTQFGAMWGIANWLIDPLHTKVFLTSTTLSDSYQRVWSVVERYWQELVKFVGAEEHLPGSLVSSRGFIRTTLGGVETQLAGLALIAGDKSQEKESITKIGFKAEKVILIGDELPLLSHGLYEAVKSNLFSNPKCQMIGIGNPDSPTDAFGKFVEPKDGWSSINENMDGWETKLGYCLRFDGLKSPNVLAGKEIYPGLLTLEKVNWYREGLGENTKAFWRMVRGYFFPGGSSEVIYSAYELLAVGACDHKVSTWVSRPVRLLFLDPSFSHGGDRAVAAVANYGLAQNPLTGKEVKTMEFVEVVNLDENVAAREDKNTQIVELAIALMRKHDVDVRDFGMDATGGGEVMASMFAARIGNGFARVNFGSAPTDVMVGDKKARDKFFDRSSQLWLASKPLFRSGQIKGLDPDTVGELCARLYDESYKGDRAKIESKRVMKQRLGKSPDRADAVLGCIDIAVHRHAFLSEEKAAKPVRKKSRDAALADFFPQRQAKPRQLALVEIAEHGMAGAGWGA